MNAKRILAAVLAGVMVFGTTVFAAPASVAVESTGEAVEMAVETQNAALAAEGDIEIATLDDLKAFRDAVNAGTSYKGNTVTLTANIDLANEEWTPIGTSAAPFAGVFDGGNNTISNLTVIANSSAARIGLFGCVKGNAEGAKAVIKNLTVENANVVGDSYVAAICGNGFVTDFENCHLTGDIYISNTPADNNYIGGIVGHVYGNITNCTVTDTVGEAGVIKGCYAGGIAGWTGEGSYKISDCNVNNIDINGEAGGVVGLIHSGVSIEDCTVENCTVTGRTGLAYCGLIAGDNRGSSSNPSYVINNTITNTTGTFNNAPLTQSAPAQPNTVIGTGVVRDTEGKVTSGTFECAPAASAVAQDFTVTANPDGTFGVKGVKVATIGDTAYTVAEAFAAAKTMTGDVVITLTDDADLSAYVSSVMTNSTFTTLTFNGNGKTITGLSAPLFTNMGLNPFTLKNVTFKNSAVVGNVSNGMTGAGIITSGTAAAQDITVDSVVVDGGTITSDNYAGAFVGYFQGHSTGDLVVTNSEVKNITITSLVYGGSTGAIAGHVDNGTAAVTTTKVSNVTLSSKEEGNFNEHKTGIIFGTVLGAKVSVDATVAGSCFIDTDLKLEKLVGRMNAAATLELAGGEYLSNPSFTGEDKNSLTHIVPVTAGEAVNVIFADKMGLMNENGKYYIKDVVTRSIEVIADLDEAYVDDIVTVTVKLNGNAMTDAEWTFIYDRTVFELVSDPDNEGEIFGHDHVNSNTTFWFENGHSLATYKLKVLAQSSDNVLTTLKVSDDSVILGDRDAISGVNTPTDKVSDNVTIGFRTFETTVWFDGNTTEEASATVNYDANNHTFVVTSNPDDATITYAVNDSDETETAPVLTELADYTITYKVTKPGYTTVEETFTVSITNPVFDIEVVKDFVKGKVAVIVYTSLSDVCYSYDGKLMVDVTAMGYKFNNNDEYSYARALAYVTDPLKDGEGNNSVDTELYKAKLGVVHPVSGMLDIIDIGVDDTDTKRFDLNNNDSFGLEDITAAYGVYNIRPLYYEDVRGMKIILKADVDKDKMVEADDAEAVFNARYGTNN